MRVLFIIFCDIMALCMVIAPVAGIVWAVAAILHIGIAAAAKTVFIAALISLAVATVASYLTWSHGGKVEDADFEEVDE